MKKYLTNIYRKIRYNFFKRHVYGITASSRVLPDFIVIGFGKAGTTTPVSYTHLTLPTNREV